MWSTGEGNARSLQYPCLKNPMDSMKRFLLVICFIHSSAYMSTTISQFIPPLFFLLGVHTFVFYIWVYSCLANRFTFVPFFWIPHIHINTQYHGTRTDTKAQLERMRIETTLRSRRKPAIGGSNGRRRSQRILLRLRGSMYAISSAESTSRTIILCGIHLVFLSLQGSTPWRDAHLHPWGCTFLSEQAAEVQTDQHSCMCKKVLLPRFLIFKGYYF